MSESKHTDCKAEYVPGTEDYGPHIITEFGATFYNFSAKGSPRFLSEQTDDNARRFAAAWNACAGIPTEALEAGVVGDLIAAAKVLLGNFDEHPQDFTDDWYALRLAVAKADGEAEADAS